MVQTAVGIGYIQCAAPTVGVVAPVGDGGLLRHINASSDGTCSREGPPR
jgi:hypothetical protein